MTKLCTAAVALVFAGSAIACSDSNPKSGSSIAFEELPAKYAEAACVAYQKCFGPLFSVFLNGSDCADLSTKRFESGTLSLVAAKIEQGTVVYNSSKAQACLDVVSTLTCDGLLERDQPACLAALDGTVALGGDCDLDEECKGSALCQSSSGTCPGKCVALLSAGQACEVDGDCDSGLQCSKETKLCVTPAVAGENCENGAPPCSPGLLCLGKEDDATPKKPGVCRSTADAFKAAEGEACDVKAGTLCQTGVSCVADSLDVTALTITWLCVKTGSYKTAEACKPGIPEACSTGNYCKVGTGLAALNGICTAIPDVLQSCGTGLGAQCKTGAVCVAGLCQSYAENGVGCTGDDMCYSEYCGTTGGCEPRLPCK
jgi:hypothetical protein